MRFSIPPSTSRATCRLTASKRNAGISAAWPRSSAIPRTSDHCVRTQSKPRSNCAYLPSLTQLPNEFNIPKGISRQYSRDAQSAEKIISWSKTTMSSDDAYGSFLEQANQSTGASKTPEKPSFAYMRVVDTNVPGTLQNVEQYYTSDADEPFEPVSLKWVGEDVPSESTKRFVSSYCLHIQVTNMLMRFGIIQTNSKSSLVITQKFQL